MAGDVVGALIALNNAFAKDDEASAKKQFERNKKLSIAMAAINTGQAVVNALTAGGNPVKLATGAQFVEAGIALAMGVAQIASIKRQSFKVAEIQEAMTEVEVVIFLQVFLKLVEQQEEKLEAC